MSSQVRRCEQGGLIDRERPLTFYFNGRRLQGFAGDTVASALLANGERIVARSFKYHRPRGIFAAGPEEPGALVAVGGGSELEPNTRATQLRLRDGMSVVSQHGWPSLRFDLLRINDYLSPLLSTGFYNKTFKWPRRFWPLYEKVLRRAASAAPVAQSKTAMATDQCYRHCDVLIVGGGPAGLAAALALAGTTARVMLVDEGATVGGWLLRERAVIDGDAGQDWARCARETLQGSNNVKLLENTTAFGYYDHNLVALCEHTQSGGQRLWRVRARRVILATGAIEQPLVFADNDLPGVMLAGAARAYLHQYAVRPGTRAVVYTNNDSAVRSALDLADAGIEVAALVDTRDQVGQAIESLLAARSIPLHRAASLAAHGRGALRAVTLRSADGTTARIECDLLCVSGGWMPSLHLHAQAGGRNDYRDELGVFVPAEAAQPYRCAGAVNGLHDIGACLADGRRAAQDTAADIDVSVVAGASWNEARLATDAAPGSRPPDRGMAGGKQFVDLQGDVTTKDVRQAYDESYVSVEHLKRYTTLGMGTDQGKTSNINGLTRLAGLREEPVPQVGATTFRPPYTPVTLATVAGRLWDEHLHPSRHTVMHDLHAAAGARFDFNGLWLRPQCYPQLGESVEQAVAREVLAVRGAAGMTDISTLGKFEIQGSDCVEFLNRVYINNWGTLSVGRTRYGVMLRDDGMVLDDGTVTRLGEQHFFITTSTGHAEHVQQHFEHLLDVAWPDLDVNLVCVTEQWAGAALAGPESRGILQQLVHTADVPLEELPYMGYTAATIGTDLFCIQARIMRVSFSGELAHEIYVPALRGCTLWRDLAACGADAGLVPYGMDAMDVMRIEKGFIGVGAEADGRTTPDDIGFGGMVSTNKAFVGHHALQRPALRAAGRLQLVGLRPREPLLQLREGSQLIAGSADRGFGASIGHISSAGVSPTLGHSVALALVQDGRSRMGEVIYSFDAARGERKPGAVEIVPPCAYDPDGKRVRA